MKRFIKLEYALMKDERIERLIEEMGLKGFGVYVMLRLMVECSDDGMVDMSGLMCMATNYTSQRNIRRILMNYDLFEIEGSHVRIHVPEHTRGGVPADTRADVHFPLSCKLEKEYYYYSKEEGKKEGAAHTIDDVRQWLMDEKNLLWRESMLMNCGYAELLSSKWPEAVEYFVTHIQAQDAQDSINTPHDAKYYFTNFSRINTASGRSLKQHLEQLEQKTMTNEQIRRALGYEDPNTFYPLDPNPNPSPLIGEGSRY